MNEAPLKILMLDDDEDEFVIVRRTLARGSRRYQLDWTPDADHALQDMRSASHDVYLVDFLLGPLNGLEVIRQAIESGVKAPLILLTGASSTRDQEIDIEALRTGAADYLSKDNLTPELLERAIRYARERAHLGALRQSLGQAEQEGARLQAALAQLEKQALHLRLLSEASVVFSSAHLDLDALLREVARRCAHLVKDACAVTLLQEDGTAVIRAFHHGDPEAQKLAERLFVGASTPLEDAITGGILQDGQPRLMPEVDPNALSAKGTWEPAMEFNARYPMDSFLLVPLRCSGQILGTLAVMRYRSKDPFTTDDQALLQDIADRAGMAIRNARLFEAEKKAGQRAAFLAEASALLASSLDFEKVLKTLAELTVPYLADWCSVEMVEGERTRQIVLAHADDEEVERAGALRRRSPPDPSQDDGICKVLWTGGPELYSEITPEMLRASALSDEHLEAFSQLGLRSAVVVPLAVARKTLAVMTLAYAESGRTYDQEDLQFMMEVAHRAALAVENAQLYQGLQEAVKLREEFLAIAGHELKTPLAAMLMHVQSLERSVRADERAPKLRERLAKASSAGRRLEGLIYQLLDVTRISAGHLTLEPERMDLEELVREVVDRFADQAQRSDTRIEVQLQPHLIGHWDRTRLDQVLTNLLGNAIKYGEGKPVEVGLEQRGGKAVLRVVDHGIGIEPAHQRRIFERFERAVATRAYGGLGLGLWIVRQIVEASGGRIEVESELGQGATFTVQLPTELQETDPASPRRLAGSENRQPQGAASAFTAAPRAPARRSPSRRA